MPLVRVGARTDSTSYTATREAWPISAHAHWRSTQDMLYLRRGFSTLVLLVNNNINNDFYDHFEPGYIAHWSLMIQLNEWRMHCVYMLLLSYIFEDASGKVRKQTSVLLTRRCIGEITLKLLFPFYV